MLLRLTTRERETFRLICDHCDSVKELAAQMGISPHTVSVYIAALFLKVGVTSQIGLLRVAARNYAEHAALCDCEYCHAMLLEVPEQCRCIHCTSMRTYAIGDVKLNMTRSGCKL